jgi:hypothetical protein
VAGHSGTVQVSEDASISEPVAQAHVANIRTHKKDPLAESIDYIRKAISDVTNIRHVKKDSDETEIRTEKKEDIAVFADVEKESQDEAIRTHLMSLLAGPAVYPLMLYVMGRSDVQDYLGRNPTLSHRVILRSRVLAQFIRPH